MRRNRRGFILVLAMLVSAALFFFALMYVQLYKAEQGVAMQGERALAAWEAASAGINLAALQVKKTSTWSTGFINTAMPSSGASATVTFDKTLGLPYATNNSQNTAAVTGWGGRSVPAGAVHLVAVGRCGTSTQVDQALIIPPVAPYVVGLFGLNNGSLGGSTVVDVYDSNVGPYPSSIVLTERALGTNTTATGKITLATGSAVKGTIQVGAGGSSSVIKGSGSYLGLVVPTKDFPSSALSPPIKAGRNNVTITGSTTLAPGSYGNLTVNSGATLSLQAGTYVFNKVGIGDNVSVIVSSGPVNFWFSAGLTMGKSDQINSGGAVGALNFFGAGTSSGKMSIDTNSVGAFTLYAPWTDITVGNGTELYGSLIGKTFTTGTSVKVHLDHQVSGQQVALSVLTQW